jgi:AcrR family transcriptional regulator
MARPKLSTASVVERSLTLIDQKGFEALTLSAVAGQLGVGPSALYTHVGGLGDLQYLAAVAATANLVSSVRSAAIGNSGRHALMEMGSAYRAFSLDHPGQFACTLLPPRSNDDALAAQNAELLGVFIAVFRATGMPDDQAYLAARTTRSALHGFLSLELNSGTSDRHGEEYQHLLAALERGLLA